MENFENFENFEELQKFWEFIEIMKTIPMPEQIDELCKSNINLPLIEKLASGGYFKLLSQIQKYHLFVTACGYESVDIAMLMYNNLIDMDALKEFMINFFTEVGGDSEYIMFRWIWEKNKIIFNSDELELCFANILKSRNIEFIEWFCSLNLIDLDSNKTREFISGEILSKANEHQDYKVAKCICSLYLDRQNIKNV